LGVGKSKCVPAIEQLMPKKLVLQPTSLNGCWSTTLSREEAAGTREPFVCSFPPAGGSRHHTVSCDTSVNVAVVLNASISAFALARSWQSTGGRTGPRGTLGAAPTSSTALATSSFPANASPSPRGAEHRCRRSPTTPISVRSLDSCRVSLLPC
jgi:hypothetical protein